MIRMLALASPRRATRPQHDDDGGELAEGPRRGPDLFRTLGREGVLLTFSKLLTIDWPNSIASVLCAQPPAFPPSISGQRPLASDDSTRRVLRRRFQEPE